MKNQGFFAILALSLSMFAIFLVKKRVDAEIFSPRATSECAAGGECMPDKASEKIIPQKPFVATSGPNYRLNNPIDNSVSVCFTAHANGDGTGPGAKICSKDYKDLDEVLEKFGPQLSFRQIPPADAPEPVQEKNSGPHHIVKVNWKEKRVKDLEWNSLLAERFAPNSGARIINSYGVRCLSFSDIENGTRVYLIPQGFHFVWPLVKVGNVITPKNIEQVEKPIRLIQLSDAPRVFQIENFVRESEIVDILEVNKNRMTPSEVGFAGWQDSTRTSSTSWDFSSKASKAMQKRAFQILGMDYDMELADALQVLNYQPGQWYKPHTDYFDNKGYDGSDPTVNNGTNRFATVFVYLSNVTEGGATVFPLSTSHSYYDGTRLVHEGTIDTPGYIDTVEAYNCCNATSKALRSPSIRGNAVLFYSQGPDGTLDPYSLHGGCPPGENMDKWSANIWVWNRAKPDKSKAKDTPKGMKKDKAASGFELGLKNTFPHDILLMWDSGFGDGSDPDNLVEQFRIPPNELRSIHTYKTHVFHAVHPDSKEVLWTHAMQDQDADTHIRIVKNRGV